MAGRGQDLTRLACFRAYDIRGRLGTDLDAGIAFRIGRGFARALGARRVVLGRDARASSPDLMQAVAGGLSAEGAEVLDLGLCGTEEMYAATAHFAADGGVAVTASHNPIDWNGMKMVRAGAAPLAAEDGLAAIRELAEADDFGPEGTARRVDVAAEARTAYVRRVMEFADLAALRPLTILVNSGNGAAGPTFDAVAAALVRAGAPLRFLQILRDPDPAFPNGIPNPQLPENRHATAAAVVASGADMGVAFDGDFDRCFFFDETGRFIDGEYIVGLLAAAFLAREPGAVIVHDPRVIWNTQDIARTLGGHTVQSPTGHAYLKQAMRDSGAVYGGEMSAHHYFRDFLCCDSGMIPWLLVAGLMGRTGQPLSALVAERRQKFPSSGEVNFLLDDPGEAISRVVAAFAPQALTRDDSDGTSLAFDRWRMNLRRSNTENVVRLNVESRGDAALVARMVAEIRTLLA